MSGNAPRDQAAPVAVGGTLAVTLPPVAVSAVGDVDNTTTFNSSDAFEGRPPDDFNTTISEDFDKPFGQRAELATKLFCCVVTDST